MMYKKTIIVFALLLLPVFSINKIASQESDVMILYNDFLKAKHLPIDLGNYLFRALCNKGKYNESLQVLFYLTEQKPDSSKYYNEIGSIYLHGLLNPRRAILYLNTSLNVDRNQIAGYLHMGDAFMLQNKYQEALSYYKSALNNNPSGENIFYINNRIKAIELIQKKLVLKDWWILGPFDNIDLNGLDTIYSPELEIKLDKTYEGKDGLLVKWQRPYKKDRFGYVNLNMLFPQNDFGIAYALNYIHAPKDMDVLIKEGSDDGIKIWINDQLAHSLDTGRGVICDSDTIVVRLDKGWNKVLLKISEIWGGWGFYFRITDLKGDPIRSLIYDPDKNEARKDSIQKAKRIRNISLGLLVIVMIIIISLASFFTIRLAIQQYQIKKLKENFIAGASHDMKTPLTSIRLYAETLLGGRLKDDVKKEKYLSTIINQSDQLTDFINNILDFSKLNSGNIEYNFKTTSALDLANKIMKTYNTMYPDKEVVFTCDERLSKVYLSVDIEYFLRAILNLLQNAQKYSPDNALVEFICSLDETKVLFKVKDKGVGISLSEIKKIFKKFYRSKNIDGVQGTGLGLSIVEKIITAHNGEIHVESDLGKGSVFTIIMNGKYHEK